MSKMNRHPPMTDATGKSFLSYRRSRATEATLLIAAQHLYGIPTWQDVTDLESGLTARQIADALGVPRHCQCRSLDHPGRARVFLHAEDRGAAHSRSRRCGRRLSST